MRTMKKFSILLLVAALLVSMVACGGGDTQGGTDGKIIVIAQSNDVTSLDPHAHNELTSGNVTRMMYDGLIRLTADNEYVPSLATSWEYLDKNTVEIKLRDDVVFHDGTKFTSDDVKFSLEREAQSSFSSHLLEMITGIEIVDETTVHLKVTDQSAALMSSLAHQCSGIVPKLYTEAIEAEGKKLSDEPCGTGPYKFDYWTLGSECQLVAFDRYYDDEYAAKNEGLRFRYIAEDNSRVVGLETGEVDVVVHVPNSSIESLLENDDVNVIMYTSCDLNYMSPNCSKAPFDNELLRRAVSYCIDRDPMIQVQASGYAVANFAPIGKAAIGYSDPAVTYEYNLEKAKECLVEAGYPDGFEFTASVWGDQNAKSAQILQSACKQVGITMNIEILDNAGMTAKCGGALHDVGMDNWTANSEPDNTYRPWFTRALIGAGGYNWSCYTGDEIETLLEAAVATNVQSERLALYAQINDFVSEHSVVWPLFSREGVVATGSNVSGLQVFATGMHLFQGIVVNK